MASTTPLPTLLKSLNIGVASAAAVDGDDKASTSNLQAAPKLPLSDQLHLLSAHIDTLEKSVQASVSSQEGKETIKKQGKCSIEIQKKVEEVQNRVKLLEDEEEVVDVGGTAVLECLAQYISAEKVLRKERRLHQVTALIRDAVLAVERLELRLQTGQLDAKGLASSIQEANLKASLLGIRGTDADWQSASPREDFRWIAQSGGAPPIAIRELGSRLEKVKEVIHTVLFRGWNTCISIGVEEASIRFAISDKIQAFDGTLAQLMETLQARSELNGLLQKLAHDVLDETISPFLDLGSSWILVEHTAEEWNIRQNGAARTPDDVAGAIVHLLEILQNKVLRVAPAPSQASFTVSKIIVPSLIPSLLRHFKALLPRKLETPIASNTTPRLEELSKAARRVYDALLKNDFVQQDLRDEAEELCDWSDTIPKQYMKNLGTQLRKNARNLLLREAGGGWQAVSVEVEMEAEVPKAIREHFQQDKTGKDEEKSQIEENGEDAWSNWDDDGAKSLPSQTADLTPPISNNKARQKRSALGGRRVVKPADELGSGPLPETDNADDVSWGFDDDVALGEPSASSSSTAAAPIKAEYDSLMEALDQEEDVDEDAWGLSEEEKVERAVKRASMRGDMAAALQAYQAKQEKEKSGLQQIVDTEDNEEEDDDAWGLSAQEAEAGKSSGSGEKLSDTTTDPWEEIVAPTVPSIAGAPPSATNTTNTSSWISNSEEVASQVLEPSLVTEGRDTQAAAAIPPNLERSRSPLQRVASPATNIPMTASPQLQRGSPRMVSPSKSSLEREVSVTPPPSPKETCLISRRSISLIELIKEVLNDIETIAKEGQKERLETVYLVTALNDILDMHRALLPVGHAETLANVPSLAMQFANDCAYIGRELRTMQNRWTLIQGELQTSTTLDFELQAQLTMSLGKRSFDGQMLLQHKMLLDCLVDAEGFTRTYEESRFNACQRSIKQVEFVLKQLQSAWRPVLTRSSYLAAMGRLVDGLLKKLLIDIETIEDISEVESEKLAGLLKTVGQLDYLFRDENQQDEESVVALFVPTWFKASYLSEILTGSLVDIEFLYFEAGALVDYSKSELTSLIRSLFADTPKRTRVIDRIQSS